MRVELDQSDVERVAERVLELLAPSQATRWLNSQQACDYLGGCSYRHLQRLISDHALPVHREEGGRLLFNTNELDAWLRKEH